MAKKEDATVKSVTEIAKMPSAFEINQQRAQQLKQQSDVAQASMQEQQNRWQQYMSGTSNPVTELLKAQKPVRNVDAEKRQKEVAKWAVISEAITTIGQSIAALGGVRQKPFENKALKNSLSELNRLDNLYLGQKAHYDQNKILDAIRNQSRGDAMQGQLLSLAQQDASHTQTLAASAQSEVLKMQHDQEKQAHREARADSRHKEAMNYKRAALASSGGRSGDTDKGEKTAYYINTKDGKGTIAIRPSDELRILDWAKKNSDNPLDYDMSDGTNSPMRRLKIQNIYHKMRDWERDAELTSKYGTADVMNNGVKMPDIRVIQLRNIDNKIQSINDDTDMSKEQKAIQIASILDNYPDREVIDEYARKNGF